MARVLKLLRRIMSRSQVSEESGLALRAASWPRQRPPPLSTGDPCRLAEHGHKRHPPHVIPGKALTEDAPGCAGHDVLPVVQLPDVLPHVGAPDAGVALHVHVVPQSEQALAGTQRRLRSPLTPP